MKNENNEIQETINKKTPRYNPKVTMENIDALGERSVERRTDKQGDDVQLLNRKENVDFTGKELDVPGRHVSKHSSSKLKDEENQLYSQGSEHNDHLEDAENHQ